MRLKAPTTQGGYKLNNNMFRGHNKVPISEEKKVVIIINILSC